MTTTPNAGIGIESMTDRCEPPEELRGVDGEHHIYYHPAGTDVQGNPITVRWGARAQGWWADWLDMRGHNAEEVACMGFRYLSPVLTPADADALRRERDEAQETAKKFQDAWGHATGERDALRADNKRLREALKAADQFITNGIELDFIRMPDTGTPDPAHDTPGIVRAALESPTA